MLRNTVPPKPLLHVIMALCRRTEIPQPLSPMETGGTRKRRRREKRCHEVSMSNGSIRAQHLSSASRDDSNRDLTSLKARMPPMPISLASRDDLQRVPAASNNRTFIPSSKQSDQQKSRSFGIQNLLNAVEGENHLNESSIFGSPSLSELNTCLLVPSPPAARSSSYHQVNQEASYSQVENREHQLTVNPEPPQPSFKGTVPVPITLLTASLVRLSQLSHHP